MLFLTYASAILEMRLNFSEGVAPSRLRRESASRPHSRNSPVRLVARNNLFAYYMQQLALNFTTFDKVTCTLHIT